MNRILMFVTVGILALRAEAAVDDERIREYRILVPQRLLPLLHAPEIHQELHLTREQVTSLEVVFSEIDGEWFRARNLPAKKAMEQIEVLEQKAREWSKDNLDVKQRTRLEQLERQAQGSRVILRRDVSKELRVDEAQQPQFAKLAATTDVALSQLQNATMRGEATSELQKRAESAKQAENDLWMRLVQGDTKVRLQRMLGKPLDTSGLKRIYPMAPEFVAVDDWINSEPVTLKELRGKVVLVHFYAFQCHNCHANFEIYRRWHEELSQQGVVVIGIQTPETPEERKPASVREAAKQRKLEFPILIDTESENWKAWGNTMWPTVYVVDKNGYIRLWWQGELQWQGATGDKTIEDAVRLALAEPFPSE